MSMEETISNLGMKVILTALQTMTKHIDTEHSAPAPEIGKIEMIRCDHPDHPVHAALYGPWGVILGQLDNDETFEVDVPLSIEATLQSALDMNELPIRVILRDWEDLKDAYPEAEHISPVVEAMRAFNPTSPLTRWIEENMPDARMVATITDDTQPNVRQTPQLNTEPDDRPWPGQYL